MLKLRKPDHLLNHGRYKNLFMFNYIRALTPDIIYSVLFEDDEGFIKVNTSLRYKGNNYLALFECIDYEHNCVKEFEQIEWFNDSYDGLINGSDNLLRDANRSDRVFTILSNKFFYSLYESII